MNLMKEVDNAEAQLLQSRFATAQLHVLWRTHLFRMSLLVLAIAFNQCRTPTIECIKNLKVGVIVYINPSPSIQYSIKNHVTNFHFVPIQNVKATVASQSTLKDDPMISGIWAALFILEDSAPEIMGIIMVVCLVTFLSATEHTKLTSLPYMTATLFVPLQLALFFQKPTIGCIGSLATFGSFEPTPRQFPISVVYHVIATGCCMLMEHQASVRNRDLQGIRDLRIKISETMQKPKKVQ